MNNEAINEFGSRIDCSQSLIFPQDRRDRELALRAAILHKGQNYLRRPPPGTCKNQDGRH